MLGISIVTTHGQRVTLPDQQLAELKASFGDRLVTPGSRGYDEARTIWNGMIHRRPALIARCETAAEVQQTVRVAAISASLRALECCRGATCCRRATLVVAKSARPGPLWRLPSGAPFPFV